MGLFYSGTLNSSLDDNGISWTASFETNGRKGSTWKCHPARKFSPKVLQHKKAVVRTFLKRQLNKQVCDMEMMKVAVVIEIIQAFNNLFSDIFGVKIRMNCVVMALIDTSDDEWCLIEDRCQKPFLYFIDRCGKPKAANIQILQTLVHFSYHYTKGQLIISNLKGCRNSRSITLSIPTIHSVSKRYGQKDDGLRGIEKCLELHRCNNDCLEFKKHESETEVKRVRTPSAPYDPEILRGLNIEETKESSEIGKCNGDEKIKVTGSSEQKYRSDEDKPPPYSPEDPYPTVDGFPNFWIISPPSATEPLQYKQRDYVFPSSDDVFR